MVEYATEQRLAEAAPAAFLPLSPSLAPDLDARDGLAAHYFPELEQWIAIIERLRLPMAAAIRLAAEANVNGTSFQQELLASGLVTDERLCRAIAADLGILYQNAVVPDRLFVSDRETLLNLRESRRFMLARYGAPDGEVVYLMAPRAMALKALRLSIQRSRSARLRIRIVAPSVLRAALMRRARPLLAAEAKNGLFDHAPAFSARVVARPSQAALAGAIVALLLTSLIASPAEGWAFLHYVASFFFLACVWLRIAALWAPWQPPRIPVAEPRKDMPVYSVLVALRNEDAVVPQLLQALDALVWPRSKLEIKLVCEADDRVTRAALARHILPRHVEIVEVPPALPRTKPKALAYALQTVSGELVVLYDAEDRPHPMQLVEAWSRFANSPGDLACLQAPLEIANGQAGQIARIFAFEYDGLFRGMLPWLASHDLVLPLGGTSNHFRVSALDEVGGWDPYNVTEDADLGLRLARFGYRVGTITLPTLEDAPERFSIWLPQRTRWFKGWMATWLVHMRDPVALCGELGFRSFAIAQILSAGLVLSALLHPLLFGTAAWIAVEMALGQKPGLWQSWLLAVDLTNISLGYAAFLLLGWQARKNPRRKGFWRIVAFTPIYWLMLSVAAWRALIHLLRRPHQWEKTPHFRMREGSREVGK